MNNHIIRTLIISVLMVLSSVVVTGTNNREKRIVISNSLSSASVRSITEDHLGRMWIGTTRGLNRYDIHSFYNYFDSGEPGCIPDNEIYTVYCDSRDRIWVSTPEGIAYRTEQDTFHTITVIDKGDLCLSMTETNDGRMILSTVVGLSVYNIEEDSINRIMTWEEFVNHPVFTDNRGYIWLLHGTELICLEPENLSTVDSVDIGFIPTASKMMRNGDLWLCEKGNQGIVRLSTSTHRLERGFLQDQMSLKIGSANVSMIGEYSSGNVLLLDSESRLFLYDSDEKTVVTQFEENFPFTVSRNKIHNFYIDSRQNVWIGYVSAGIDVKYNFGGQFNRNNLMVSFFKDKPVYSLATDANDDLFCLVLNDALYKYSSSDHVTHKMTVLGTAAYDKALSDAIGLFVDRDNDLWLGSGNSLLCFSIVGNSLKVKSEFPLSRAMGFAYDASGKLWVSGYNPYILRIDKSDMTYQKINITSEGQLTIASSLVYRDGRIICGAYPHGIKSIDPETLAIKPLISNESFSKAMRSGSYIPTSFYVDSDDAMWISTNSNGLFRYFSGTDTLEPIEGLPCSDVVSVIEDEQGSMWIGSADGLSKRNMKTGVITNYYKEDGIGGNQFYDRSVVRMSDGTIVLGGMHGITLVDPSVSFRLRNVPLVFEDLKVNNALVEPGPDQPIDRHLSLLPDVRLAHDQHNFSISFASLDYNQDLNMNYMYKLEGYDKDWIDSGTINVATYSNITPGRYRFVVKAIGKNGALEAETSLRIRVSPTVWGTWWMKLSYILLILTSALFLIEIRRRMMQEKDILLKAEMEKEQEKRMNRMNMSFFANVAHEFRTPLTMISGPVGVLSSSSKIVGRDRDLLEVVKRSVNRMLQLVNQFMDFNKLENDTLRLSVSRGDIVEDIKYCMEVFTVNGQQKSISVTVHCLEDHFEMWYDSDKLVKVISNLMSNALKFTPSGGSVSLSFDIVSGPDVQMLFPESELVQYHRYAKVVVTDTGIGIPEDKYEAIFQRYVQLDNQSEATRNIGTGIGLYYAKALVELHHGLIKASSRSAGSGSIFTFVIPVDDEAYLENEKSFDQKDHTRLYPIVGRESAGRDDYALDDNQQTILVVDDDIDVANYLEILLSNQYKVTKCYDGESALESIKEVAPDIVISDVVMPGMTGYQLCEAIKTDIQLSHIPVILVTAKVTVESQVEGLGKGADAYVTKPFEPTYLAALIESMLKNREMMRKQISTSTEADDNISSSLSSQDSRLLKDLYAIMEAELVNPELDVEQLSHKLKISRTKLYYKIKGLTGVTPGEFFRQYKLNRASQLLKEGRYNVSEVADMTGFASQSYFSTAFKKQFGVSPSEYK